MWATGSPPARATAPPLRQLTRVAPPLPLPRSRAVLHASGGIVQRLSVDHKAESEEEVARIEAAGGFVKGGRVLSILAVAR